MTNLSDYPIRIVHTMGGCGGTLLSRCLGTMPGVALLSEVNPESVKLFRVMDPLLQDEEWLHLLTPEQMEYFSDLDLSVAEIFRELIVAMSERAKELGRHLVIRDYNYVDFVGVPFVETPARRLTLYEALPEDVEKRSIALVRHPVDQWLSLCKHEGVGPVLTPTIFCEAYEAFLKAYLEVCGSERIYRYEDFVWNPEREMRAMCKDLNLPFDPEFASRFHSFDFVTGDFSRSEERNISLPERKFVEPALREEFLSSRSYAASLELAGYLGSPGRAKAANLKFDEDQHLRPV